MTNKQIIEMLNAELTCIIKSTTIDDDAHCDEICDNCEYAYAKGTYGEREEMLQSVIRQLERPKGKWEYNLLIPPIGCCSSARITCSKCGYSRQRIDGEILKYCPNCGAEMEGAAKIATTTEEAETFGDIWRHLERGGRMSKCMYMPRNSNKFPCDKCNNKNPNKCKEFGGKEPLTCKHCYWYVGFDKIVCLKNERRVYNIRTCEKFTWD